MGEGEGSGEKKVDEPSADQHDAGANGDSNDSSDSSFDDLIIEVDLAELEAELGNQPPGRKY